MFRTFACGSVLCLAAAGPAHAQTFPGAYFPPQAVAADGPPPMVDPRFPVPGGGVEPAGVYTPEAAEERPGCQTCGDRGAGAIRPETRVWFGLDYLYWNVSAGPGGPPLAATTAATSLAALNADPGLASPVNRNFGYGMASGGRLNAGYWGDEWCCVTYGVEGNAFLLERRANGYSLASGPAGTPAALRPFTDARTGAATFAVVGLPGTQAGQLSVFNSSQVWGAEVNLVRRIDEGGGWHWDTIAGVRYLDLDENLSIVQNTTLIGTGVSGFGGQRIAPPRGLVVTDAFDTRSQFFGGNFGTRVGKTFNRLSVDGFVKVGIGWAHLSANSSGTTAVTSPGAGPAAGTTLRGGLLAVPANGGHVEGNDLAIVPEVGLQLGYDVTDWLRLSAGYSALYWSRVARPGDQINGRVNPTRVPSSLEFGRPGAGGGRGGLVRDDLWINGVNFGAAVRF